MAPGQPTSFRLSAEAKAMLEELEKHMGVKRTAVVEMAIRHLHRKEIGGKNPPKKRGEGS